MKFLKEYIYIYIFMLICSLTGDHDLVTVYLSYAYKWSTICGCSICFWSRSHSGYTFQAAGAVAICIINCGCVSAVVCVFLQVWDFLSSFNAFIYFFQWNMSAIVLRFEHVSWIQYFAHWWKDLSDFIYTAHVLARIWYHLEFNRGQGPSRLARLLESMGEAKSDTDSYTLPRQSMEGENGE